MIPEDKLIGWLCILIHQWHEEGTFILTPLAHEGLIQNGWIKMSEKDWMGNYDMEVTGAGRAIYDIHGGDWGVDVIPVMPESEA